MAGPLAAVSAAQIAQELPAQAAQHAKKGAAFEQSLNTHGGDGALKSQHAQHAQAIGQVDSTHHVTQASMADKARGQKVDLSVAGRGMDPVAQKSQVQKSTSMVMSMMANMEKGQVTIDKLIDGGLSGKSFSNSELLGLQASMYKYTQELDLCSKVVEKATNGLKDTLKTQV